ncbi:MAG: hypothetical protein ACR2OI_03055 [Acidimicrobiia bacterium]
MANLRDHHTTHPGRSPLETPTWDRSSGRPKGRGPQARPIFEVLRDLAEARGSYEQLRVGDAPLMERARLVSLLHELRAEASEARKAVGRA